MTNPWDDIDDLVQRGDLVLEWGCTRILDLGFGGDIEPVLPFFLKNRFTKYVGVDSLPDGFSSGSSFSMYTEFI